MEDIFTKTKELVESSPACQQGMQGLKTGAKISIILEPNFYCELVKHSSNYSLEKTKEMNGDILLKIHPDALNHFLQKSSSTTLAELGIEIIKEIFVGRIQLEVLTSTSVLVKKGYLTLPLIAGAPFLSFLANLGLHRMTKLYQWIEVLRKKDR